MDTRRYPDCSHKDVMHVAFGCVCDHPLGEPVEIQQSDRWGDDRSYCRLRYILPASSENMTAVIAGGARLDARAKELLQDLNISEDSIIAAQMAVFSELGRRVESFVCLEPQIQYSAPLSIPVPSIDGYQIGFSRLVPDSPEHLLSIGFHSANISLYDPCRRLSRNPVRIRTVKGEEDQAWVSLSSYASIKLNGVEISCSAPQELHDGDTICLANGLRFVLRQYRNANAPSDAQQQ